MVPRKGTGKGGREGWFRGGMVKGRLEEGEGWGRERVKEGKDAERKRWGERVGEGMVERDC